MAAADPVCRGAAGFGAWDSGGKYLFLSVFSGDGWSSPLLLVYSVFLLLLYFAWVALFAALLALLIYPILKKLRI